jgi:thymidylate synthase (FAD)
MKIELIDTMGSDISVVNAARVSFGKVHDYLTVGDQQLIQYLADHQHWSPFAHAMLSYRISAPIFVARQLVKHQVGLTWNEVSRRYVDDEPDFWYPDHYRGRADDKKQGSSNTQIDWISREERTGHLVHDVCEFALDAYKKMLDAGICPEQARMVLPQNTITEWLWTGSLYAFARVCNLRCKDDAQEETRNVAWEMSNLARDNFPVSWKALRI